MTNITCYDLDGDVVKHLTQWDHDLTLVIDGVESDPMPEFRYYNRNHKEAIVVDSNRTGTYVCAEIPDELLQEPLPITVQLFYKRQGAKTKYSFIIPVSPSKKPANYKYTPTEGETWEKVEAAIRRDMAYKLSAPNSANAGDYLRVKVVNIDGTIEVEAVAAAPGSGQGGSSVAIDTSLSKSGQAADAKVVGDALSEIEAALGSYIDDIDALIGGEA